MQNKPRLQELDALRGITAFMVAFYHIATVNNPQDSILEFGATGVELFFIISGFVIFMTLERCKSSKDFIVSRFSKLYPAYWAAVTITFVLYLVTIKLGFHQTQNNNLFLTYFVNLTMLQYYFNIPSMDGPYWTLIVELVFYVFMWLLFVTKQLKNVKITGSVILVLILLWRIFYDEINETTFYDSLSFAVPLLKYFPLFFTGIIFYDSYEKRVSFVNYVLIASCILLMMFIKEPFLKRLSFITATEFGLILLTYCIFFFLFIKNKLHWMVNRGTLFLGEISYSLYLIHNFTGARIIAPGLYKIAGLPFWISVAIALIVVTGIAYAINRLIEKPAMYFIRRKWL
jgi:peptidoglycan/LPS O-acetylase OafA/YrhL